jgi:hypothetical protein
VLPVLVQYPLVPELLREQVLRPLVQAWPVRVLHPLVQVLPVLVSPLLAQHPLVQVSLRGRGQHPEQVSLRPVRHPPEQVQPLQALHRKVLPQELQLLLALPLWSQALPMLVRHPQTQVLLREVELQQRVYPARRQQAGHPLVLARPPAQMHVPYLPRMSSSSSSPCRPAHTAGLPLANPAAEHSRPVDPAASDPADSPSAPLQAGRSSVSAAQSPGSSVWHSAYCPATHTAIRTACHNRPQGTSTAACVHGPAEQRPTPPCPSCP